MNSEPSFSSVYIPSLTRRAVAKAIDIVGVAFTVVGFSSVTHSYLAGLLIGYAWLALSDWFGSPGKWIMKLEVRHYATLDECSAWASFVRNLPIIAVAFPHKLHQALLGMDRQQYREAHSAVILVMACVALVVLVAMVIVDSRNAKRCHIGDYLARTLVISRRKRLLSSDQPSPDQPVTPVGQDESSHDTSEAMEAVVRDVHWLPAGHPENPFPVEVLDCRPLAQRYMTFTTDKEVAESFVRLRSFDGSSMKGRRPEQAVSLETDFRLPFHGRTGEGPIYKALQMEDLWDIYTSGNEVYLAHSRTGELIHVLECEYGATSVVVRRIYSKPDPRYAEASFVSAEVKFVLITHLAGAIWPFPIPATGPRANNALARAGLSAYGRRALFGTYEWKKQSEMTPG